ncbi:hypothetical protein Godav_013728 [Gossypium davidsonii]|uniref:RNase H type-1 domain-containing protein n=1 Tax=Gossypium davidsonii TaxID=34287 RepID=A0A7J8RHD1_GOSDV|nr:hypothetical protein [Gossypium davidsonii]
MCGILGHHRRPSCGAGSLCNTGTFDVYQHLGASNVWEHQAPLATWSLGKEEEAKVVWERAVTLCHDFRIHNLLNKPLLPVISAEKKWAKPPYDTVKINFDATVLMKKMGYGMLARDSDGFVLVSRG